jgi:hypothetical protein
MLDRRRSCDPLDTPSLVHSGKPSSQRQSSMTSQATPRGRFQLAIQRGQVFHAEIAAREPGRLNRADALALAALIASDDPKRYGVLLSGGMVDSSSKPKRLNSRSRSSRLPRWRSYPMTRKPRTLCSRGSVVERASSAFVTVLREPANAAANAPSIFMSFDTSHPVPVREQNIDANGNIKVHEQGTANVNATNSSLSAQSVPKRPRNGPREQRYPVPRFTGIRGGEPLPATGVHRPPLDGEPRGGSSPLIRIAVASASRVARR